MGNNTIEEWLDFAFSAPSVVNNLVEGWCALLPLELQKLREVKGSVPSVAK